MKPRRRAQTIRQIVKGLRDLRGFYADREIGATLGGSPDPHWMTALKVMGGVI